MNVLEPIILLVVVAGFAWILFSPRFEFRVRISRGSLKLSTGKVARDSLSQLQEICNEWHIERGWIGGIRRGKHVRLAFSRSVPPDCRQQIRNMWENR